ncbi:hypothetical protein [Trebonia sp.]|uniref:hypothetical protein n=1 Tax=Trebonia sp. TaxID=2767075 RepID=UPI002624E81B|nr:hypothetical protein [Trebonia sp.]
MALNDGTVSVGRVLAVLAGGGWEFVAACEALTSTGPAADGELPHAARASTATMAGAIASRPRVLIWDMVPH